MSVMFTKPPGLRYVDMCKEFDEEFYSGHRDDFKLFKYMYLMYSMMAHKSCYFQNWDDYDQYARFAATTIYLRFLKKEKNGERVKSLKNYVEKTKGPLKVMYQNEAFNDIKNPEVDGQDFEKIGSYMQNVVTPSTMRGDLMVSISDVLEEIPTRTDTIVRRTPYKNDPVMVMRLKTSVMLTILNGATARREVVERIRSRTAAGTLNGEKAENVLLGEIQREREAKPILWRLDESMSDYVRMLANKVRYNVGIEINDTKREYTMPDDVMDAILSNAYKEASSNPNRPDEDDI